MRLASSASASSSSASSSPTAVSEKLPNSYPVGTKGRRRMDKELSQLKSAYPLQRGSACLSCRKRKMKCDAGKPSCGQCVKANRAGDCDYDDGKSKSRTQILQDKIAVLEGRIRELEGPPQLPRTDPAAMLYDHVVPGMYASGSSSSFDLAGTPSPESPWLAGGANGYGDLVNSPQSLAWDVDPLSMTPDDMLKASGRWWEAPQPPQHIKQLFFDIFLPHRHQCGLAISPSRLLSSTPPHTALLNSTYALACHFSGSPLLTPHEPRFVARALSGIADALESSEQLVDVLQASCLLAVLFFIKGRLLEGYYHAGAAARLAVGLGLHQISLDGGAGGGKSEGTGILPPPANAVELGERILTFWQVFNLDRCWAVATGLPVALADDCHPRTRIETVWPRPLEDYEMGNVSDTDYSTVNYLYTTTTSLPLPPCTSSPIPTLRAKATTLFERAARLAASFSASEQFWTEFTAVDSSISRLSISLPPARPFASANSSVSSSDARTQTDLALFTVHVLLHAAMIQLHAPFALKDVASQQKSAAVAALASGMINELEEGDYAFLDPILGTCWTSVAEALVREGMVLRGTGAIEGGVEAALAEVERQLDVVVAAMGKMGATVPLAAYQASKVDQSRGVF